MAKQTTLYMSDGSTLEEVLVATDYSLVKNKPSNFPPTAHDHPISQVTDLQSELDKKENINSIKKPFIIHDSDIHPGIVSKSVAPMAMAVSLAFKDSVYNGTVSVDLDALKMDDF